MGLQYSSVVDAPVAEVFAWHERPGALLRLLPPWQPIRVVQEASLAGRRAGGPAVAGRRALGGTAFG